MVSDKVYGLKTHLFRDSGLVIPVIQESVSASLIV